MTTRPSTNLVLPAGLLLLAGAAAGALIAWSLTSAGKEKLAVLGLNDLVPKDALAKLSAALAQSKDRVIEAIDSSR